MRDHVASLHEDLKDMVEEILPFTSEFTYNLITIMDDEDTQAVGMYSDDSILDKYHESQGKKVVKKPKQEKPERVRPLTKAEEEAQPKPQRKGQGPP